MSGWNRHQTKVANSILADLHWLAAHEWLEDYDSARAYELVSRAAMHAGHKTKNDCTGTPKLVICHWNGVPVFDGEPEGFGNTQTFFNGPHVYHIGGGPDHWQPLDLLLYKNHAGPFQGGQHEHCTVLLEKPKTGPWPVFSMGGDHDPTVKPWNYRNDLAAVVRFPIPLK